MAKSDGSSKGRAGPLEKLDGNPLGRLAEAVRKQETIVVCGGGWENVELLDTLAKSIPTQQKVVELRPRGVGVREDALPPDHVVLVYNESLEEITEVTAAANMAGDYLIVPEMRFHDVKVFQRIAHNFKGGIMVGMVDAFVLDDPEAFPLIADVLINTFRRDKAPLDIGEVWARPSHIEPPDTVALPNQSPRAAIFTEAEGGVIGIAPPTIQDRLANTPEVLDFYKEVREQVEYLAELGPNMLGQRLHQAAAKFQECLPGSFDEAIERRTWSRGNALRVILSQHNAITSDLTHPHRLEPSVAETLRGLVELFNQLAFADPSLRSRDAQRPGPQDVDRASDSLRIAVQFIPSAAASRDITNHEAGAELSEQINIAQQSDAAAEDDLLKKLSREHAAETVGNFVIHATLRIRNAVANVTKEVTSGFFRQAGSTIFVSVLPQISPAIVHWFIASSEQLLAFGAIFFEHVPAFREMVEWLRARITDDGRSD
jgi:hypothetical protein